MANKVSKYWKPADRLLAVFIVMLVIFGLVAVFSASSVLSFERYGNNYYYITRQLIFAVVGISLLFLFSRIDYHFWKKWSTLILLGGAGLLLVVLIPGIGFSVGGARSWFNLGFSLAQPSELVKLGIIFYLASWFERKIEAEKNFWFGIIAPLIAVGIPVGLVVIEPDIGTALLMSILIFVIFFAAGTRYSYLGVLFSVAAAAAWLMIKAAPYRAARIVTFLDPSLDPQGIGYHINQALLAVGSGGFWGYGLGGSIQKHNYLPEPIGDSIFAVMAEELGFIRIILVVLVFFGVAWRGFQVAKNAPDKFGQLTAIGITSLLVIQALINMGAIMNIMPFTGITLPFVSYGGSSLLVSCIGAGILLNISRQRA